MMPEKIFPIKWDDFYKFIMSVGILFIVLAVLLFFVLLSINTILSLVILIIFFPIGFLLSLWASERWFAKQRIRDRIDLLESLVKTRESMPNLSPDDYGVVINNDPINALLDKEEKSSLLKFRALISATLKNLFGIGRGERKL